MGSSNQAMWKTFGIESKRDSLVSCIPHPVSGDNVLHFLADVPHVIKNLRNAFATHKVFTIADDICRKHNLHFNCIKLAHVLDLLEFQSGKDLKLAPNLSDKTVSSTGHFSKMNVANAMHLFSKSVSAALRYLVSKEGRSEEYLTTAWFIDTVDHWFDLMSSRHSVMALSKHKLDAYADARSFLDDFIQIVQSMRIGFKYAWKPVQAGIHLSTRSILNICDDMLDNMEFLLTSRLTQDCIENLFSSVRCRSPVPTAREFKYALKLITVAQYLKPTKASNYVEDEREYFGDLLPSTIEVPTAEPLLIDVPLASREEISAAEEESLYYLAGYCLQSLLKLKQVCEGCCTSLSNTSGVPHCRSGFLQFKNFKEGALCEVSGDTFALFKKWESVVRSFEPHLKNNHIGTLIASKCMENIDMPCELPTCHPILQKLVRKFVNVRLHILCKKHTSASQSVQFGSRSMAMRTLAQNIHH